MLPMNAITVPVKPPIRSAVLSMGDVTAQNMASTKRTTHSTSAVAVLNLPPMRKVHLWKIVVSVLMKPLSFRRLINSLANWAFLVV